MNVFKYLLPIIITIISCNTDDGENNAQDLEGLLEEINVASESVVCEDPSELDIIIFGYGICGFTTQKIAVHTSVNTEALQSKITDFTALERELQSRGPQVACLSIAPNNLLINTTEFVTCVSGESTISTDSQLNNEPLLGRWELVFSQQTNGEGVEFTNTTINFDNEGFSYTSANCTSMGTYNYDSTTNYVNLSATNCNETARMFIYDYDPTSLGIEYPCIGQTDLCYERYQRVIE